MCFFCIRKYNKDNNILIYNIVTEIEIHAFFRFSIFKRIYTRFSEGKNALGFLIFSFAIGK